MSDMAAASSGHPPTDHLRISALVEAAIDLAEEVLEPGGTFVAKVLGGGADASLVARLNRGGWTLLDAQFRTDHLEQFGLIETPQEHYLERLAIALKVRPDTASLALSMSGAEAVTYALQPTTQAS